MPDITFKNTDEAAGYLAAMIDGEGSVQARLTDMPGRPKKSMNRSIAIANTDMSIVDATVEAARILGIRTVVRARERTSHYKIVYRIIITGRDNLETVHATVPIRSEAKRARLKLAVESYLPRRIYPTPDDLRRWYVDEQRLAKDIAAQEGISLQALYRLMRKAGISRRTRSEFITISWTTRQAA